MWKTIFKGHRFFFIALIVFLMLVTFVDKNNALDNIQLHRKTKKLEDQREFYLKKIHEDSLILENLKNPEFLEQYARENFYMKQANEQIYLVR